MAGPPGVALVVKAGTFEGRTDIMAVEFASVDDLISKFRVSGSHYFDKDTLRCWGSRIGGTLYAHRVFTSSEKSPVGPRSYSVCIAERDRNGHYSIAKVGGVCAFATAGQARRVVERVAALVTAGLIPDVFEYGQDAALAVALAVAPNGDTAGWVFDVVSGFRKDAPGR